MQEPANPTPFQTLQFHVSEAVWRWKTWKQLFVSKEPTSNETPEQIALMLDIAPAFFSMLQGLLFEDVVLRICKLIDPKEGGPSKHRRLNLSVNAAHADAIGRLTPEQSRSAECLVTEIRQLQLPFKHWRDRQIAHEDHNTATGLEALPPLLFAEIEHAFRTIITLMRLLDPDEPASEFAYDSLHAAGDGDSLIDALRRAKHQHDRVAGSVVLSPPLHLQL